MLKIFAKLDLWHLFFYFHHMKGSRNNIYYSKNLTLCYGISYMYFTNILEAHPGGCPLGNGGTR